jgi:hypothetical protein
MNVKLNPNLTLLRSGHVVDLVFDLARWLHGATFGVLVVPFFRCRQNGAWLGAVSSVPCRLCSEIRLVRLVAQRQFQDRNVSKKAN